jgi:hypothetical protein
LCFNYSEPQWWIEEYPWPLGDGESLPQLPASSVVAGPAGKVYAQNIGSLDVISTVGGDNTGKVVSATHRSLTTSGLTFPTSGVVDAPIAITEGRGKRQLRRIVAVNGQTITVDRNWSVRPDSTSVFQIGGIPYSWRSGWSAWTGKEAQQLRSVRLRSQKTSVTAKMDLRIYDDYGTEPVAWGMTWPRDSSESSGVTVTDDNQNAVVDLSKATGIYISLDNWQRSDDYETDNVSVELRGYSCSDRIALYQIDIEGATE